MFYLFSTLPLITMLPGEEDQAVSRQLIGWWAEFAKTGRPGTDSWAALAGEDDDRFWMVDSSVGRLEERPDLLRRFARWTEVNRMRDSPE
jgi:carboxylesterase type B